MTYEISRDKSRRPIVWIAAFIGALVLSVLLTVGVLLSAKSRAASEAKLENFYRQAFMDLSGDVDSIDVNLSKLMVTSSRETGVEIAGDISKQAEGAVCALSRLPIEYDSAAATVKYLNQLADFCDAYSRAAVSRTNYDDSAIESFHEVAEKLNAALNAMREKLDGGERMIDGMSGGGLLKNFINITGESQAENSVEYPELIYDGPFSDGKLPPCFRALEDLPEVSEDEAKDFFSRTFSADNVSVSGTSESPKAFVMSGRDPSGNEVYASISVNGGKVLTMSVYRASTGNDLDETAAEVAALAAAEKLGYKELVPVWYNTADGFGLVNLAPEIDGVVYYTDLVKAKVDLGDGTVVGLEATGYCRNHCERGCSVKISQSAARAAISKKLVVYNVRKCVVPYGESERLCYELAARYRGLDYFVYIDAVNGSQVNIMRVIDGHQGRLTI